MSEQRRRRGLLNNLLRPDTLDGIRTLVTDSIRAWLPGESAERSQAGIPVDAGHRREQLSRLGTSAWLRLQVARLVGRVAGEDRAKAMLDDAIVKTAEDAYEVVGNMKGAMMKLAQFASFQPGIPAAAREKLKALQTQAPSMTAELAAECIERELGSHPDELFARFDRTPIASAPIG